MIQIVITFNLMKTQCSSATILSFNSVILIREVRAKKVKVLHYIYTLRPFSLSPLTMYCQNTVSTKGHSK